MYNEEHAVTADRTIRLVDTARRRRVLRHLMQNGNGPYSVEELAEALADGGAETARDDRLAISLSHVHLPKLEEAGVIDYDRTSEVVRYLPGHPVEELLVCITETLE